MQVGGSAPPSHCSGVSESESRSGGIQRLSPTADVGQAPAPARRRPASEHVSSPSNNAGRTRPKTSCCCYRCCFCWRCQCNGLAMFTFTHIYLYLQCIWKNVEIQIPNVTTKRYEKCLQSCIKPGPHHQQRCRSNGEVAA